MDALQRVRQPEWRQQNSTTKFPLADHAKMSNGRVTFVEGWALDAAVYPPGGRAGMYVTQVVVGHGRVTLTVGDAANKARCSGGFALVQPPDRFALADAYGVEAGVVVSESARLAFFQSWGVGTHVFKADQTPLAAAACFPRPEAGVRGVLLPDGTLLAGEVWVVGGDGVLFRTEELAMDGPCGTAPRQVQAVRMDVVGDPLFRRRQCDPRDLFKAPRPVKAVRFVHAGREVLATPDERGDLKMFVGDRMTGAPALRLRNTAGGIVVHVAGSTPEGG